MRLFVTFALFVAAVQAASDADYWIARGDKNANLRLDEWKAVVEGLSKGNDDGLAKLLAALPPQLKEARDNSRKLMSTIGTVISGIKKLTDGSPNLFQKLGLRGVLAVLGDKRDNKSYYLLDGAQNWASLRAAALKSCRTKACTKLAKQLTTLKANIIETRDALEERAQNFVSNRKKLNELKGNIEENLKEIQSAVNAMAANPEKSERFLELSDNIVQEANDLVSEYSS